MAEMTIIKALKRLHLYGIWRRVCLFAVNNLFVGMGKTACRAKRLLLRAVGFSIGENTTIVGPIYPFGDLKIGRDCWIGKNMIVNGNGSVTIGDRCDIAPEVSFLTGGHAIGDHARRAGDGEVYHISVGDGVWIGSRSTILGNTRIGDGSVIAACACVIRDVPEDRLVGGVPAGEIRSLTDEPRKPSEK